MQSNARNFVIAFLVFTALIAATLAFIKPFADEQATEQAKMGLINTSSNTAYVGIYGQSDNIYNLTEQQKESGFSEVKDLTSLLLSSGVGALGTLFDSASSLKNLITELSNFFGLPSWFILLFTTMMTTVVAFIIIDFWRRWYT